MASKKIEKIKTVWVIEKIGDEPGYQYMSKGDITSYLDEQHMWRYCKIIADGMGEEEYETGRDIINSTTMTDKEYPSIVFNGPEELQEDYETFVLCFDGKRNFCKTARKPYDLAVKCLLILADKYGLLDEWSFDGDCEDEEYVKAHDLLFKLQLI